LRFERATAIAIAGTVLRLALILRSPTFLDRLFVPDDTYYTLTIARSIAHGLGPTVDGTHLTSGFQPLLAFLLLPYPSFRLALVIGALADGLTTWLLARLTKELGGNETAAATLWALSPAAIATALNGLETSLALACIAGALVAFVLKKRWLGAVLGLCLLARVDTVFLVAALGIALARRDGAVAAAKQAAQAAVVVAPWWLYSLARFGTFIPESGAAVREQAMMYRATGMVVRDQIAWAAAAVTGPPLLDSAPLREFLGQTASGVGCALGVALALGALYFLWKTRPPAVVTALTVHALCIFLFYALYLPATWFFRRYLVPVHLLVALLIALRVRHRTAMLWIPLALAMVAPFFVWRPLVTPDQRHHGAKGYREPALEILAEAPPDAVIGSFQSGALGWFATGNQRVVNLDGVVDREAAEAVREHRIAAFAKSRGVTHLADWDVNARKLVREGKADLIPVGEAEPQGENERFVLYEIRYR
jgi:hypothetical protein